MSYTGINLENVKISNRSAILKLLSDNGAMSRKDIASALGLTPATVTLICTEFLSSGVLCEKGMIEEQKKAGRKKVLLDINYQYRDILAICIESDKTYITITDMKGRVFARKTFPTDGSVEPKLFLKKIADESRDLMQEQGISKDRIMGAGVSLPGLVNRREGMSVFAYRIWNRTVPVREYLQEFLELPVIVENNVKAFAEGEMIYGIGKKHENLLFIKWGPGVGSAIVIDDQIYDSQNSKTAEIGHYIVEKDGKQCRCGRRGCLETKISTHAVVEQVRQQCNPTYMPGLYQLVGGDLEKIAASNIMEWSSVKDQGLEEILDRIIELFARVVVNTMTLLAPDKVIIYGYMFDLQGVQERFLDDCAHYDPAYKNGYILKSCLSSNLDYIGPLAIVMNEQFLMAGMIDEGGKKA